MPEGQETEMKKPRRSGREDHAHKTLSHQEKMDRELEQHLNQCYRAFQKAQENLCYYSQDAADATRRMNDALGGTGWSSTIAKPTRTINEPGHQHRESLEPIFPGMNPSVAGTKGWIETSISMKVAE
jgi:hypothetical protein